MQYHRSRLCSIAEKQVPEKDKASIGMQSYDERQKWHQQALLVALENTTSILQARSLQNCMITTDTAKRGTESNPSVIR